MDTLKLARLAPVVLVVVAAGCDTMSSMTDRVTGRSHGDSAAASYWDKHAQSGYMSRSDAMQYDGADGRRFDFSEADSDHDMRLSESEWKAYHRKSAR